MTSSSGFTTIPFRVYLVLDVAGDEDEAGLLKQQLFRDRAGGSCSRIKE
jgi:hypothetical protein